MYLFTLLFLSTFFLYLTPIYFHFCMYLTPTFFSNGKCFVMTANLDGETNLKPLFASKYEVSSLLLHIFLVQPFTLAEVSSYIFRFSVGPIKKKYQFFLHQRDTRVHNTRASCQFERTGLPFLQYKTKMHIILI